MAAARWLGAQRGRCNLLVCLRGFRWAAGSWITVDRLRHNSTRTAPSWNRRQSLSFLDCHSSDVQLTARGSQRAADADRAAIRDVTRHHLGCCAIRNFPIVSRAMGSASANRDRNVRRVPRLLVHSFRRRVGRNGTTILCRVQRHHSYLPRPYSYTTARTTPHKKSWSPGLCWCTSAIGCFWLKPSSYIRLRPGCAAWASA